MPGNEVGDRIHNFFEHGDFPQGQHPVQGADGNWRGLSNNLGIGNQRQVGAPLNSNPKNYNFQQSDSERGQGSQSLLVPDGLNYMQLNVRPEFPKHQSPNEQKNSNNCMYGHQVFQKRQNEGNFLGVDAESDRHYLTPKVNLIHESQQGTGPGQNKTNYRLETSESPINFDLFGGQQQMNSQQLDMMQWPRQQSEFNDMQLLQQQLMFKQMQEFQMQQQIQHLYATQQNSLNQPPIAKQAAGNLINGTPVHDVPNYPWSPELMAGNSNWLQRGVSTAMQGSFNGHMFSPEHGQAPRLIGLVPQHVDQSLYGIPISNTRDALNHYSHIQVDNPAVQQIAACSDSLPGHQFTAIQNQLDMQDVSRQGFQGKNCFGSARLQSLNSGGMLENSLHVNAHQSSTTAQEFHGRQSLGNSSEISQERTVRVAPSQSLPILDPTEEKILFGTDNNLWDAFGNSTNNTLNSTDSVSAFSSAQCGTWSALMQSAVAETSSGDIGLQEEWNNLSFQNTEPSTGNYQPVALNDIGKQQTGRAENSLQMASSLGSRPLPANADMNNNHGSVTGHQQSGLSLSQGQGIAHRSIQQSSESSKWLGRSPFAEANKLYASSSQSSDGDLNDKNMSGRCTPQRSISLYTGTQVCNKSDAWNFTESISPSTDPTLKIQENVNSLHHSQSNVHKRLGHDKMGRGDSTWTADSVPKANLAVENLLVNREDAHLNNVSRIPDSIVPKTVQETSQLPNNYHLDRWRHVDSSAKCKKNEDLGGNHHHMNRSLQVLGSSADRGAVESREIEKENSGDSYCSNLSHHTSNVGVRDNIRLDASDSRTLPGGKQKSSGRGTAGSRKFQYHPMGNLDMDAEPSYGSKPAPQSSAMSQQVSRGLKSLDQGYFGQPQFVGNIPRNPMERERGQLSEYLGDGKGLDEVPSRDDPKSYVHNKSAPYDRYVGIYDPSKPAHSSENMLDLLHKVDQSRESGNVAHFSNQSSEIPEAESSDGSAHHVQQNQSAASQGFGLQLAPPSQRLPILNRTVSSQSSTWAISSPSSSQVSPDVGVVGRMWLASSTDSVQPFPPRDAFQGEPGNSKFASVRQIQENSSPSAASNFAYTRNHLQNKHTIARNGQMQSDEPPKISYDGHESGFKQIDGPHDRAQTSQPGPESFPGLIGSIPQSAPLAEPSRTNISQSHVLEVSVSLPSVLSGVSLQGVGSTMLPNTWTNVSMQQQLLGAQSCKNSSNLFKSHFQPNNNLEIVSATQKLDDQDARAGWTGPSKSGSFSVSSHGIILEEKQPTKESPWKQVSSEKINSSQRTASALEGKGSVKHLSDASPSNSAGTQSDIEAFGRSLRPNNFFHQNYSLLHQVQGKCMEADPSYRVFESKGLESGPEAQPASKGGQQLSCGYDSGIRDASVDHPLVTHGDLKILKSSSELGGNHFRKAYPPYSVGTLHSQDVLFVRHDSQDHSSSQNTASIKAEQSQVSPQMAPSWFEQYGTFNNRQMLQMYDAHKNANVKAAEQQLIVRKSSDTSHAHNSIKLWNDAVDPSLANAIPESSTSMSVGSEHFSSHPLPPDVTNQSLFVVRPKKRKSATFEFISWHKEVMQGSQRFHDFSMAEIDWAQAANRLMDKIEDGMDMLDDGPPTLRPKRRLRLTTQLMQQIFRPPLAPVLSVDASSDYESVVYFVARSALGDACSLASCSKIDTPMSLASGNLVSDKLKTSERIGEQYFSKVMEDLIGRSRKLEKDLLGLDKRASILDLRVECIDLEKFSMINRFAKFHGQGQTDAAEVSSSSYAIAPSQKTCLQRYVTALPVPRNLPDRVQCLSL